MPKTLEENMEEMKSLLVSTQSEVKEKTATYDEHVANTDTAIKAMEEQFANISEQVQTAADEKKALADEVKNLTLAVARGASSKGQAEEIQMSDTVKKAYSQAIRKKNGTFMVDESAVKEITTDLVKTTLTHLDSAAQEEYVKNILATGSDPAGGMFCPVPVDSRIRKRIFETSPMRQMATVMNVNTEAIRIPLDDEDIEVAKTGEVNVREQTGAFNFASVRIPTHELYAYPVATLQVLEDSSINLESYLSGKVSDKFRRDQNKAFIVGDGEKEAKGILSYEEAADIEVYERFKIGTLESEESLKIGGDDYIQLQSHLQEEYQDNANFLMHRLIWAKAMQLKDSEGQYLLNPAILFSGVKPQILGAPVRLAGDMPKPTSVGALVSGQTYVAYGDFRESYTITDRLGINVIFDNITQPGFVKWNFRTRYGGGVTNFQSYKLMKAK